ncbi:lactate dehydrogenase-like 2-hydroxyacid dehydrogenase [Humitalea rosea]|uniref:Lactate dehydrogenase-like 2-hydroxyacid dehydrogenase n=1 Tax=Humitalea rosea TaxID=990373 RepID=A0A2W7JX51_9PROT|nr:D-glycerate dehydrogenase [Humitalea rosea]PZW40050.1 lactate dehydrogenase-like 2-hydroxyacid dehydrogenase [Humitalea rosea]
MTRPKLLVTRHLPEAVEARAARDYAAALNPYDVPWTRDSLVAAAEGAAGLLCAAGDPLDAGTIQALPATVKIIATFSVGTDHIALDAAKARGIAIANTPDVLSVATAEIAMLLVMMAARRASEAEALIRARAWAGWAPTQLMGVTLEGKRLGILGMGRIGRELAQMARGFGMQIHYRNRSRLTPELEQGAVFHGEDDAFLGAIDILSMHIPGGAATRHWLNAERIGRMRPGSIVVNTGRGSTVDDVALCAALGSGHIRAAGLDVFDGEPKIHPGYLGAPNVSLLPHLGSATIETRDAMGFLALDNLDALLLRGEAVPNRVV